MKCSRFCTEQRRPKAIVLRKPPWIRQLPVIVSGFPHTEPHWCSRLELATDSRNTKDRIERQVTFQQPSAHHPLFVQTARRPNGDSLQVTLDSLEKAGSCEWKGQKWIVSDGYLPEVPVKWEGVHAVTIEQPGLGSAKTFLAILQKALEVDPMLECLTYFQDDVVLSRNSLDYIAQVQIPADLSLISWFNTDWLKPDYVLPPILGCRPTRWFIRSQAITLTRSAIEGMLYCYHVINWPRITSCDAMPAWALGDIPYADHYPSLVQHTEGFNSACNMTLRKQQITDACPHQGARISPSFMGEDFDALSLMAKS